MLKVLDLHTHYGHVHALKGVSLEIKEGECVALLGANGAGKTTLLKSICGILRPTSGSVEFKGERLERLSGEKVVTKGISMVPEGRRVFPDFTVEENLKVGAYSSREGRKAISKDMEKVMDLFPRLQERRWQKAGTLSGGEQQMLAIGRALMAKPKLLLLDEPSLGLAPIVVEGVVETLKEIHSQGTTILLVEQNALIALGITSRAYVLETGKITLFGNSNELINNQSIRQAYLGSSV